MSHRLALCLALLVAQQPGLAQLDAVGRGQLLYDTHCVACHTEQVHWRNRRLATDWNSLRTQVLNWRDVLGLTWDAEEIDAVTGYLNARHYGFEGPRSTALPSGPRPWAGPGNEQALVKLGKP